MNILVCGDFSPVGRHLNLLETKSFNQIFGEVKSIIEKSDYSIVNFETCISKPGDIPIKKHGPNLSCTESGVEALKWAGFDCVTLANNHFRDFGNVGVSQSLDALKKLEIDFVGGGECIEKAAKILYKQICNETLAVINVCEHEFSIATKNSEGSNPLDIIDTYQDIQNAKKNADYVLVIVHGGHEHFQLPSLRMQKLYKFFIDVGADAVINHHQHCFSGYEIYKEKPIFYGLGNFCFDDLRDIKSKDDPWHFGYMVQLNLNKRRIDFELFPYSQCSEGPSIKLLEKIAFNDKIGALNEIIANPQKLQIACDNFYKEKQIIYELAFEPYKNRLTRKLFRMGLLPRFLTNGDTLYRLINIIECESHRDRILKILKERM